MLHVFSKNGVLKERQIPFQTLFPARLKVRFEDETRIYENVEEATQDLSRRAFPMEIISPPETLLEKVQQLTWETSGRQRRGHNHRDRQAHYKKKLQVFRRVSPSNV